MSKNMYRVEYGDGSLDSAINYLGDKINVNFWDGQTPIFMLDDSGNEATYISDTPITQADREEYDKEQGG